VQVLASGDGRNTGEGNAEVVGVRTMNGSTSGTELYQHLSWNQLRLIPEPMQDPLVRQAVEDLGKISLELEAAMIAAAVGADPAVGKLFDWYGQIDAVRFVAYVRAHLGRTEQRPNL
jgi:hypothetical protein